MAKTDETKHSPIDWMRWVPAALVALIMLAVLLVSGRILLLPLLVSLALAYLLSPVVEWFVSRGWSRSSSALMTLTAATVALVLILIFILPGLWVQVSRSYEQTKTLITDSSRVEPVLNRIKQASPPVHQLIQSMFERFRDPKEQERLQTMAIDWLQSGLFRLVDLTATMLDLLLIPFFVYYLLADYGVMRSRVDRLVPPRFRPIASKLMSQINEVLSNYVRTQLWIALIMGALYTVGFLAFRVPMAFTLGMLSGLLNFVPYLGTLSGIILSVSFVILDGAGIGRIIGVLMVFVTVQSIEGYILTPRFLGSKLNLHPLWVLVGLMIGGNLFGLLGIILAVPVIAVAKVLIGFLEEIYQQTDFYSRNNLSILSDQGFPIPQGQPGDTGSQDRPRRAIITTSEISSRIKENLPPSND